MCVCVEGGGVGWVIVPLPFRNGTSRCVMWV